MTDWWRAVEDELERRGFDAPDPWAAVGVPAQQSALTPEQRAFLEQVTNTPGQGIDDELDDELDDQPEVEST